MFVRLSSTPSAIMPAKSSKAKKASIANARAAKLSRRLAVTEITKTGAPEPVALGAGHHKSTLPGPPSGTGSNRGDRSRRPLVHLLTEVPL